MKRPIIRKDEKGVSPVIATILMVAITVVLAAVLYVMVTGLLSGPGATIPRVTFGSPEVITNGFKFQVAGATLTKPAASFRVAFSVNGTTAGTAQVLDASNDFVSGGDTYTMTWSDLGGEGDLTGGDEFRITRVGGLRTATDYVVTLLWTDGSSTGARDYST
jgi:flagellin-like protein